MLLKTSTRQKAGVLNGLLLGEPLTGADLWKTDCYPFANSSFFVIYEVFFIDLVAEGFYAKNLDSLDLIMHYILARQQVGSCMSV